MLGLFFGSLFYLTAVEVKAEGCHVTGASRGRLLLPSRHGDGFDAQSLPPMQRARLCLSITTQLARSANTLQK